MQPVIAAAARRTLPILVPALLAACSSGGGSPVISKDPANGTADVGPAPDPENRPVYVIPADTMDLVRAWLEKPRTLLGDVVEADLSAKPFLGEFSVSIPREQGPDGKPIVEKIEATDPKTGVFSITLVNRSGFRTMDTFPTVRLGTGLTLIGIDRVVLRFDGIQPEQRPLWVSCVATGQARLLQTNPERRLAGESIRLGAEVVQTGEKFELRETETTR